ncbi:GNAT family N-acetyltransferase [Variovorax sp. 770b2]|uniref:GNAT family N-acetyltransferase n=1 Tax=Variovorax sp. 770b2 TaxID=1566271 RepID=UPI0008F19508|nr:GNAT family N-acetyltransferase [Variovorax sp. 770b2]SFP17921.1 Ribosomal protein S18 acetylase RimI [Variovorax sp. 770b2]
MNTLTRHTGAHVREAVIGELVAVQALYAELRPDDPVLAPEDASRLWRGIVDNPYACVVVAEVSGQLGATCMLATIPNLASGGRRIGIVEHVITASAFRRRGFARQVLRHALSLAWAQGCCKVLLLSGVAREEAHGLYESVGFRGDVERGFVAKPAPVTIVRPHTPEQPA